MTDGFAATYETEGNILTIHFLAETLAESITSLGTIVLTAGSVGDYEIHLCGTLVYDEDLACKLYSDLRPTDGKCNVTVKSTGGGGSSSGSTVIIRRIQHQIIGVGYDINQHKRIVQLHGFGECFLGTGKH